MIIGELSYYTEEGEAYPIYDIPEDFSEMKPNTFYCVEDTIYLYVGNISHAKYLKEGEIGNSSGRFLIHRIEDPELLVTRNIANALPDTMGIETEIADYLHKFSMGENLLKNGIRTIANSGDLYMPLIEEGDNDLTKIIKLHALHKKMARSEYKASEVLSDGYSFDNMISALNGNTTINRFLDWCELMDLSWKIKLVDTGRDEYSFIDHEIIVSPTEDCDFPYMVPERSIFLVPLEEGDDPLKRLVKRAVYERKVKPVNYKKRGSTKHLFNNMMSALKRGSRMMFDYFMNWCEILSFDYAIETVDNKTGYQVRLGSYDPALNTVIGDMSEYIITNDDEDDENL